MEKKKASDAQQAVILFADLESFHRFLSQPDVQQHIWTYLDIIFDAITVMFRGGQAYWDNPPKTYEPIFDPQATTFLGDGAAYYFNKYNLSEADLIELCNRVVVLGQRFNIIREKCQDIISPGVWVPERIRFGMSAGTIFLRAPDHNRPEQMEARTVIWCGYSVGLASRLCSYLKKTGPSFIASARLPIKKRTLTRHKYKCVMAQIREGIEEKVFVDNAEYDAMLPEIRSKLFREQANC